MRTDPLALLDFFCFLPSEYRRLFLSLLGKLESLGGIFQRLSGEFVSGEVILLLVVRHRSAVSVRGKFMKFSGPLMRIIRHASTPGI